MVNIIKGGKVRNGGDGGNGDKGGNGVKGGNGGAGKLRHKATSTPCSVLKRK